MEYFRRSNVASYNENHKLVGFGAGEIGRQTMRFLLNALEYFLDNEPCKWGKKIENVEIFSPAKLEEEYVDKVIIIICSEHYESIACQLKEKYPNIKIYLSPLLKDYAIFESVLNPSDKLLVTAYGASGGLYLVDPLNEQYKLLLKGAFRGILKYRNTILVASEKGGLFRINALSPFSAEELIPSNRLVQLHGLTYWENKDLLIVAEAENDTLKLIDAQTFAEKKCINLCLGESNINDRHHINDLYVKQDTIFISMISRSGWWKSGIYDGGVFAMDLTSTKSITPLMTGLKFPHSIKFINNELHILESASGRILSGKYYTIAQLNGFLRGLDGNAEILYVGQSRERRINDAVRYYSPVSIDAGIYVINPDNKIYKFIKMPERCEIYAVLALT
jgi:hypothetical protein